MSEQAAKLLRACRTCNDPCTGWAVQLTRGNRLRWELEWSCDRCGISHDGDWGPAPTEVRSALLAQHGSNCVRLPDGEFGGGGILKAFRDAFNLSIQDSLKAAKKLKQSGFEGTYVEAHLLSDLLREGGIATELDWVMSGRSAER